MCYILLMCRISCIIYIYIYYLDIEHKFDRLYFLKYRARYKRILQVPSRDFATVNYRLRAFRYWIMRYGHACTAATCLIPCRDHDIIEGVIDKFNSRKLSGKFPLHILIRINVYSQIKNQLYSGKVNFLHLQ